MTHLLRRRVLSGICNELSARLISRKERSARLERSQERVDRDAPRNPAPPRGD